MEKQIIDNYSKEFDFKWTEKFKKGFDYKILAENQRSNKFEYILKSSLTNGFLSILACYDVISDIQSAIQFLVNQEPLYFFVSIFFVTLSQILNWIEAAIKVLD